jgi:hypothetical protein
MGRKMIIQRVSPNGEIEIEAVGFKGNECLKETEFIINSFGGEDNVKERKKKAEWWLRNGREVRKGRSNYGIETNKLCG